MKVMKKAVLLSLLLSSSVMADTLNVNAQIPTQYCPKGKWCNLTAKHDIQIINTSDQAHSYNYTYRFCDDMGACHELHNSVTVAPHATFYNHGDNILEARYLNTGNFQLHNYTVIDGYQKNQTQGNNIVIVN